MGSQDAAVARLVEMLRRDGTVVGKFSSSEEAAAWRAVMRHACRAAGLRIRTGLANADRRIAWVYHVDHVLTEAENRAARRAIDAAYNDEPRVPFHQMVREEQRTMLQVVRGRRDPHNLTDASRMPAAPTPEAAFPSTGASSLLGTPGLTITGITCMSGKPAGMPADAGNVHETRDVRRKI